MSMRNLAAVICLWGGLALLLSCCGRPTSQAPSAGERSEQTSLPGQRSSPPANQAAVAVPVDPDPRVGAIFLDDGPVHICTGAVLHSTSGDLVLTAAHCLLGGHTAASFIPGFGGADPPPSRWKIDQVYFDPRWIANQDPRADYAIARVSGDGSLQARVGSALLLGRAPARGAPVTVTGYPAGLDDTPIACSANTEVTEGGFPELSCHGLVAGTSGAPWVSAGTVTGVIGGLEGGGCTESVSYSAPLDEHAAALLVRAEAGGPGDDPPVEFDDACL
ncbi:trypsin-like serine peptidase [Mycobacterium marinum]|uniref:trypsin-like serine peptidase n=1 Tax=Mycobacterium marinum TaxID=1781 RepID=UPI000358D723|nr:trypsin-like peptidase domain-containing protein [Mycobacterium marinum]EPQ79627.1 hypothetical protein MMEU_0151 [Mycobacterium marinum str. Europe]CDM76070.1 conserved hypothetical secreted protein [Mycobacterium marinum E11]